MKAESQARDTILGNKMARWMSPDPHRCEQQTTAMSAPTNKKETQAFLGVVGFWKVNIPNYKLIVSPLYHVTWKKNDFKWGPEHQQAFEQIKQEMVHAGALGPVWTRPDVKNVLYTAARENGPTWSLWQKAPGDTRGQASAFGRKNKSTEYEFSHLVDVPEECKFNPMVNLLLDGKGGNL
ncbi:hypothetical protein AAES_83185 [Amazona aestiva]|uniref:Reverse transcriptase/retrotransposon-derived protein RNase H-like domain-containing protein n=1 Tax=Amazona aestiva TaxID=12930 RepID=A0A0Q3PYY0_AMAAE|nr:hypothetical protein AAES_83185 [Amazona aestiva]